MINCVLFVNELEIYYTVDEKDIEHIKNILSDNNIIFEEDSESLIVSGKDNILECMFTLSRYYTLAVD